MKARHDAQRGEIREQAKLRERRDGIGHGADDGFQFENLSRADTADFYEINFSVAVNATRRRAAIHGTRWHRRKLRDGIERDAVRRTQRPDVAGDVVAAKIFSHEAGEICPAINVAADDAAVAVRVRIFPQWWLLAAEDRGGFRLWPGDSAFHVGPLIISAGLDDVHFLARVLADIALPDEARHRVLREAIRIATTEHIKFFKVRRRDVHERVAVRNEIIRRKTFRPARRQIRMMKRLHPNRVARGWILVHINAENSRHEPLVHDLRHVILVVRAAFIAHAEIQIAVLPEHQVAGIVKLLLVELLQQDDFGIRVHRHRPVRHGETRQSVVGKIHIRAEIRIGPPFVGDIDEAAIR